MYLRKKMIKMERKDKIKNMIIIVTLIIFMIAYNLLLNAMTKASDEPIIDDPIITTLFNKGD